MEEVQHLQISFFTKQEQYSIPDAPYSLPATSGADELNNVIHSVRSAESGEEVTIEFDFLIDGEFLKTSLESHLEEKNISTENVVAVEYVERAAAPRPEASLAHDDWVSCVRGSNDLILCGCYDNTIKLWTRGEKLLTTIPGHTGPVKAVAWLPDKIDPPSPDAPVMFASGSHDQTMLVWRWSPSSAAIDCLLYCRGHAGSVDCVAANADGERIVTGSWDKTIKLWSTVEGGSEEPGEEPGAPVKKRLKGMGKVSVRLPLTTLAAHKEAVAGLTWMDGSHVASGSWDHTLRLWDMATGQEVATMEGSKAFFSVSHSPLNNLLVTASADRHVRVHDIRTKELKSTFSSHSGWVSSVAWSTTREMLFISGGHDAVMKLWDMRSPKAPLYNMIGQEDKILAVDWSIPDLLLSGGADNQLKIFNYHHQQT